MLLVDNGAPTIRNAAAVPPLAEGASIRVWRARTPINGLTYEYGGLEPAW
ncbi:hypothetical protein AB0H00_13970 [Nocardia sp. NPDC023852]